MSNKVTNRASIIYSSKLYKLIIQIANLTEVSTLISCKSTVDTTIFKKTFKKKATEQLRINMDMKKD